MSGTMRSINEIADSLPEGRKKILLEIAESLSTDVQQEVDSSSELVTSGFADAFAARLLAHHAMTKSVMKKRRFEYAMLQTAEAVGYDASLARSSTNPGEDIQINGANFSLKTEAAKGISRNKITISKLQEARWIRECDSPQDFASGTRQHLGRHVSQYERIFILRVFQPDTLDELQSNQIRYDLVEVPVGLLEKVLELPPEDFKEPSSAGSSGAAVRDENGKRLFYVTLDGSVEKVTIRSLRTDECKTHGSWIVPFSV
jgi:hypothetical protein